MGYGGFAEEMMLGEKDLREQFGLTTELPVVWQDPSNYKKIGGLGDKDFTKLYWRLRGPNHRACEDHVLGFRKADLEFTLLTRQPAIGH